MPSWTILPSSSSRYRCLKCFSFDMCQDCFFVGKGGKYKNHKMAHPMQEYCTTVSGFSIKYWWAKGGYGEDSKDSF